MTTYELKAAVRSVLGRKVKALRRAGNVPGNVFGKKKKSVSIQMNLKELLAVLKAAGETSLIQLKVEGESKARPVLVAGYHLDPVSGALLHVDLHEVDLTEKTKAAVPVKTVGESSAVAAGNVLVVFHNEIEVEALPADFPEAIEIDISGLTEVGAVIHVKDLKVDRSKITLEIPDDEVMVTVQEPAKEEVVAPPPAEAAEAAEGEAAPAEAGKPESGETAPAAPAPADKTK